MEDSERDKQVRLAASDGVIVADKRDKTYYSAQIRARLDKSAENIVAAGRLLIEAKAKLKHGEWLPMLKAIPLNEDKARILMAIAKHPIISNPERALDLPTSWATLYELIQLPIDELEKAIADGTVTNKTKRKDVKKKKKPKGKKAPGVQQAQRSIDTTPEQWEAFKAKAAEEGYASTAEKLGAMVVQDIGAPAPKPSTFTLDEAREVYLQALIKAFPIKHYKEMSSKEYAPLQQGLVEELAKLVQSKKLFVRMIPPSPLGALLGVGSEKIII